MKANNRIVLSLFYISIWILIKIAVGSYTAESKEDMIVTMIDTGILAFYCFCSYFFGFTDGSIKERESNYKNNVIFDKNDLEKQCEKQGVKVIWKN